MHELVFPISAAALTLFGVVPMLTLLVKAALTFKRRRLRDWASFGAEGVFAALVLPVALPFVWLFSSALHQSEAATFNNGCLVEHPMPMTCLDALILSGLLLIGMSATILWRLWRTHQRAPQAAVAADAPLAARVNALCASHPKLADLRVRIVHHHDAPVYTLGLLKQEVILDACFAQDADDDLLIAALLHERAHVNSRDALRVFIARVALSVNPLGHLLAPELERWRHAREAQCDGDAVLMGGQPLALAAALLRAARFNCTGAPMELEGAAALCGHDALQLKLRVALLLEASPASSTQRFGHLCLALLLLIASITPHIQGLGLLEHFHLYIEQTLRQLL